MTYGVYEIVQVLGDAFLITSTWHMCRYATSDKQPLAPGFYFVLWPSRTHCPDYDKHARYVGPVPTKLLAETLKTSAMSLGLLSRHSKTPQHANH